MKNVLLTIVVAAGLTGAAFADASITLEGVHNCCGSCEKGITKAVESVKGATVTMNDETVTITAKNSTTAKKAAEALLEAGYYGKIEGEAAPATASSTRVLNGATVSGAHLCCKSCVKAVEKALASVAGVTGSKIEAKTTEFVVEGEFNEGALIAALNQAGFHGKVK